MLVILSRLAWPDSQCSQCCFAVRVPAVYGGVDATLLLLAPVNVSMFVTQ